MPLNEVWDYRRGGGDGFTFAVDEKVWVERVEGFGIDATVKLLDLNDGSGGTVDPEATRSIRIRWRPDLSNEVSLRDPLGRDWFINGWQEVGRQRFIDLSVSYYAQVVINGVRVQVVAGGGVDGISPGVVPLLGGGEFPPNVEGPWGWKLQSRGESVFELEIDQFLDAAGNIMPPSHVDRDLRTADGPGTRDRRAFTVRAPLGFTYSTWAGGFGVVNPYWGRGYNL